MININLKKRKKDSIYLQKKFHKNVNNANFAGNLDTKREYGTRIITIVSVNHHPVP